MSHVIKSKIEINFTEDCEINDVMLVERLNYFEWDDWGDSSSWMLDKDEIKFHSFSRKFYPSVFPPVYEGFSTFSNFTIDESELDEFSSSCHEILTLAHILSECIYMGAILITCEYIESNGKGEIQTLRIRHDGLASRSYRDIGIDSDDVVNIEYCDLEKIHVPMSLVNQSMFLFDL